MTLSDLAADGMLAWNYGGALILDGMWECVKQFGFTDWAAQIDTYHLMTEIYLHFLDTTSAT